MPLSVSAKSCQTFRRWAYFLARWGRLLKSRHRVGLLLQERLAMPLQTCETKVIERDSTRFVTMPQPLDGSRRSQYENHNGRTRERRFLRGIRHGKCFRRSATRHVTATYSAAKRLRWP